MSYYDVFRDSNSVIEGAIMFIDISDSTSMKEKQTEAAWLNTFGWFFDTIEAHIKDSGGNIVKYLGDGAMIFYDMDSVAKAINAAIKIQEDIFEANAKNTVSISCTIGISEGIMRVFYAHDENIDYIGNVVDRAARLSNAASPKAIFVDTDTINAAAMNQVSSIRGKISRMTVKEYIGEQQLIMLKGFSGSVAYHEIKWGDQIYGVKSQYATDIAKKADSVSLTAEGKYNEKPYKNKKYGVVYSLKEDIGRAFIRDETTGQEYYTDKRFIAGNNPLTNAAKVFFIEKEPLRPGTNSLASAVVIVGETYSGKIKHINCKNLQKQFASIELSDTSDNEIDIFAYLSDNPSKLSIGEYVTFEVDYHSKGPSANNIRKV